MTTPEELKQLNIKVAELKGIICCDKWLPANMSRMEPTFYKQCDHKEGECIAKEFYPPKYSEDIKLAWELFEEIKWFPELRKIGDNHYECNFDLSENGYKKECETGETAPEAIARAWIRWKKK